MHPLLTPAALAAVLAASAASAAPPSPAASGTPASAAGGAPASPASPGAPAPASPGAGSASPAAGGAASAAPGKPTAAEMRFVSAVTADLQTRFPSTADAVHAGYIRYTDEDTTGAISYADRKWTSADAKHPSQLWYDAHGKLIGADFSEPFVAGKPPGKFGLLPSRWGPLPEHVHYGLVGPNGTTTFGGASNAKLVAAGDRRTNPTAAGLVKAGIAKKADDVRFVFDFPAIWDAPVWLVSNPDGAFADADPLVKPSAAASGGM